MPCGLSRAGASPLAVKPMSRRCSGPATRQPLHERLPCTVTVQFPSSNVALEWSIDILKSKQALWPWRPNRNGRPTQVPLTTLQPKLFGSSSDAQYDAVASFCGESCVVMCASVRKVPLMLRRAS